ncbi:hypothetical protein scyTo_0001272 [Scyliorhinus torazame]|uniref:Uncharacterized protein n=1 Tax=Scyliorhinus torazame TaxID=75743 RepID=A0A401PBB6_SCYTO|nr:hypothetical protein [Scyliorhinus torazame]
MMGHEAQSVVDSERTRQIVARGVRDSQEVESGAYFRFDSEERAQDTQKSEEGASPKGREKNSGYLKDWCWQDSVVHNPNWAVLRSSGGGGFCYKIETSAVGKSEKNVCGSLAVDIHPL